MNKNGLVVLAFLCAPCAALAQDSAFSVSVGARAWYAQATTFSYITDNAGNQALIQSSADTEWMWLPVLSVRYGNFVGSVSGLVSTDLSFANGDTGTREEFDANIGYTVIPGLTLSLGYKKVSQGGFVDGEPATYRPSGPVLGLSANAPLSGPVSFYGALGVGRLKTPGGDKIKFKADYNLAELGLAYTLYTGGWLQRWVFTGGYRIQVMGSKEALGSQDGRDTTQGFSFGAIATF